MATTRPEPIYFRSLETQPWERGDREATAEWQNARMLHAMTRAVAEKSYPKVTVADIVALAGVSRRTFYEHFKDVEDCFVAAYETGTRQLLEELETAVRTTPSSNWHERFQIAIEAYTRELSTDPDMARACLVDVLGAGQRAIDSRRQVYARFVAQMRFLRHPRGGGELPEAQFRAVVGAIGELVQEHIFDRGAESLEELTPTLVRIGWALLERPAPANAS
jgi:AcrR family transcriptional regulator